MSLLAIKNYMKQAKVASMYTLCHLFNTNPEMMRCLLKHWIQKGKLRACERKPACGSTCFKCPSANIESYEWIESEILFT
jgi:hypothetical protein